MAQTLSLTPRGLFLQGNDLGSVPDGAMSQADDVVIAKDGILEPRRGGSILAAKALSRIFPWKAGIVGFGGSTLSWSPDGASWSDYAGSYSAPAGSRLRTAEQNGNLYITTSAQTQRLEATGAALANSGIPQGLQNFFNSFQVGTGTLLAPNAAVAYRLVYGHRDANGNTLLGAPSGRTLFANITGTVKDPLMTIRVPWGLPSGSFVQVYRSPVIPDATNYSPSDEMSLVAEVLVAGAGGSMQDIVDNVPDGMTGAALYTNASQEGVANGNAEPPGATDVAAYRSSLFLGGVTPRTQLPVTLLGTGAPSGLQSGDTVTVTVGGTSVTKTAGSDFVVFAGATGYTTSQNIWITSMAMLGAFSGPTLRGFYVSSDTGLPGQMVFESSAPGQSVSLSCSRAGVFGPSSLTQPGTTIKNRLMWSKQQKPDAVPLLNYADLGSKDAKILRIIPTRDSLFIFKEDGLWRLTGDAPPWTIAPFDPTCILKAPETAVALDNSVFALTNQGVVRVTDTGVTVISRAIEGVILPMLGPSFIATTASVAFATAYESAREYRLSVPALVSDTKCTQTYVYNLFTKAWYRDTRTLSHAIVNPADDRLYFVDGANVWQERKTFSDADYADGSSPILPAWAWTPRIGDSAWTPGRKHHWTVVNAQYRKQSGPSATYRFWTDLVTTPQSVPIDFTVYGNLPLGPTNVRTWVPLEASRGSELYVQMTQSVNGQGFQFQALGVSYRTTSEEAGN